MCFYSVITTDPFDLFYHLEIAVIVYNTKILLIFIVKTSVLTHSDSLPGISFDNILSLVESPENQDIWGNCNEISYICFNINPINGLTCQ